MKVDGLFEKVFDMLSLFEGVYTGGVVICDENLDACIVFESAELL